MNNKTISIIGFLITVAGVIYLMRMNFIFSKNPVAIIIQILAFILMIWARLTFGMRSFHAAANTTKGELVTDGPYRWFRHPIYAALIFFFSVSIISYPCWQTIAAVALIITGLSIRMYLEEKFLIEAYPDYREYSRRTKRIVPFII